MNNINLPKSICKTSLGSGSSFSILSRTVDFEARMILWQKKLLELQLRVTSEKSALLLAMDNLLRKSRSTCSQFYQHFMSAFAHIFLCLKSSNLKCKYKKVLCETFVQKSRTKNGIDTLSIPFNEDSDIGSRDETETSISHTTDRVPSGRMLETSRLEISKVLDETLSYEHLKVV